MEIRPERTKTIDIWSSSTKELSGWSPPFWGNIACSSRNARQFLFASPFYAFAFYTHRAEIVSNSDRAENQSDCRIRYRALMEDNIYRLTDCYCFLNGQLLNNWSFWKK